MSILGPEFFSRDTLRVARDLLGKDIVRRFRGREQRFIIVDVEAYDGPNDKASHAHKGRTPRTRLMYGRPGYWYVYLVYGMHWLLNIVTGPDGYPAAVLIRGIETVTGERIDGPARVARALRVGKTYNGKQARCADNLWIEDVGRYVPTSRIRRSPRIGVDYAGEWAQKPYRFHYEYIWRR